MKRVALNCQVGQLSIGDLDSRRVGVFIQSGLYPQSFGGGCVTDQIDDNLTAEQRATSPILGNVTKHAVLDFVPFAGAGRKVANRDGHTQLVRQLLELHSPQPYTVAVAAATVCGDEQPLGVRIKRATLKDTHLPRCLAIQMALSGQIYAKRGE
jgi:hypothetical protein